MSPHSQIIEAFERLSAEGPEEIAVIDGTTGDTTSRLMLVDLGRAMAHRFSWMKLLPGDRVAVQLRNSVDFIAVMIGALEAGLTVVPIDRDATRHEVMSLIRQFGIRAVVQHGVSDLSVHLVTEDVVPAEPIHPIPFLIKLTSGSTGRAKGVVTSEENLIEDCRNICGSMQIRPGDRSFGAIPLSHSYGFSNLVTPLLTRGTSLVVTNDYLPLAIIDICNRLECTVVPGVPTMFEHLAQLPESDGGFRIPPTFISAGAPLKSAVSRRFAERFGAPIHSFYGCSECGGIAYDREGRSVERGSVGHPMSGVEIRLGENDRVVVSSGAAAMGYINASAEEQGKFAERQFSTDDIGHFDQRGELHLTGRINDLINIAGKKVNPLEIETTILDLQGVRDCRVYGAPGGARGELVIAAVVADPAVSRDDIRRICQQKLSAYKVPRVIRIVDAIPVDERGKVKKAELEAL